MFKYNSTIFKEQLINISTVLNNTGNTTQLLTSFNALDVAQQKVLLSSKLLTEEQKAQCLTMATLSSANTKYTAEQLAKATGVSAETLATWGLTEATDTLTMSQLAEIASSDAQAKKVLEKIVAQNAQAVVNGEVTASNITLAASEGGATLATGAFTTAIKANIATMWTWMTTTPIGWITMLVGGLLAAVTAYNALTDSVEETKEKAEDLISTYKTALDTANSHKESIDNITDRYEELSKGVNNLGENVSLTAEEYQEYNSIVNDIAEMFPTMVQGYTDEGNAILKLKGNVDALREAYEAEAQAAYNSLISTGKDSDGNDILKDANNVITGSTLGAHDWGNAEKIDYLDKLMDATDSVDSMLNLWDESLNSAYSEWFEDFTGVGGTANIGKLTDEDLANIRKNAKILKQQYQAEIDSAVDNAETLANAYLMTNEDYAKLDEQSKNAASIMVNSLNADIVSKFGEDKEKVGKYVDDIVQIISTNPDAKDAMIGLFTMDTTDMPVDDIEYWTNAYIDTIAKILQEDPTELKIRLGFDNDTTEPLKTKVQGFLKDEFDEKVGELTLDELEIASKLEIPEGTLLSWDELIAKIEEVKNASPDKTDIQSYLTNNKELEQSLIQLSKTGKLDEEAIKSYAEYDKMLELCGGDADKLLETLKEIANTSSTNLDATNNLTTITGGLDSLAGVYQQAMEDNFVESDAISNLYNQFGDLSVFNDFVTAMQNIGDEAYNTADAFNELANAYIETNLPLSDLTESTKRQYIEELEGNGITNAKIAVEERLAYIENIRKQALASLSETQQYANLTTEDLANATITEINTMIDAANAAGSDTSALNTLGMMKAKVTANQITESTSISEILSVAKAAGIATPALSVYNSLKNAPGVPSSVLETVANNAKNSVLDAINNFDFGFTKYQYSGSGKYSSSGSGSGGGSSSPVKDTTKQYNWLEVAITRVQEAISRLNKIESNSFIGWIKRNVALNKEISKVTDNINLQRKAYEYYMSKANSVGLSDEYKQKVKNGAIQIEDITDETLQNQIDQYQEWYDKAIECSDAIQDLNINLSELQKKKFDNIRTEYDSLISLITSKADILDERMNRIEKQGYFVNKDYYEKLIAYENAEINNLKNEYSDLQSSLEEGLSNGLIEEGSEEWSNMKSEILDVEKAIEESTTSLIEYGNALRELNWEIFDYTEDRISSIVDETEFLIDLLSNSNLYDDTGRFNDYGESVNALRAVNYNTYMQQALDYANELKKIESDIAKDPANKDLIERREELLKLQQEAISNAESEKDAIKSLVQDGINIHLDALNSLIDKYKDALNSAKDLYDYQKNIGEQTQEISNFEKIISAYQGDNSEESRKLIQDYQNKLDEAKQNLKETEWDRYISETGDLLDTLYSDYEDVLNARLDDVNALIADMITEVNNNSASVKNTIESETEKVGYQITDTMETIFSNNSTIVSSFMDKFTNSSTAIQTAINDIKNLVSQMIVNGNTDIMTNTDVTGAYTKDGWSQSVDGTWTYRENGNLLTNQWIQSNDKWYHLGEDGNMDTDKWIHNDSGSWSYVGSNGDALTGWQQLSWNGNTDWYNFDENGTMKEDTWIDDYFLDSSGKMRTSSWIGHNGKYYWVGSDGKWLNLPGWSLDKKPNDGFPIYEYAKGSRYINKDQLAWIAEEGTEIIRTKDGALLQALPQGSTVFTNEMTQRLWDVAKGNLNPFGLSGINIPNIPVGNNDSNNISSVINVTVEANDPDEFARKLGNKLLSNRNFISGIQESTLGQALGRNKLSVNKFKM